MMDTEDFSSAPPPHYYGDIVRKLFLLAGLIMIITLPIFSDLISVPVVFSVIAIMVMAFLAGLQSPKKKSISLLNLAVAVVGYGIFQYQAFYHYAYATTFTISRPFFAVNQILALLFFGALYYGSKTVRGAGTN